MELGENLGEEFDTSEEREAMFRDYHKYITISGEIDTAVNQEGRGDEY